MPSISAYLTIDGAAEAIAFYTAAFGAEEVMRMPSDDHPGKLLHAEIKVFGGSVMMSDAFDAYATTKSPKALGGTTFNLIVSLDTPAEVDAHIEKAVNAGAKLEMAAEDMFWGARFGAVFDPFGHMWAFNADLPKD